jgi:hypothetical protein
VTLFDVIRYPVSTPPTEAELSAIPAEVYKAWAVWLGANGNHVSHQMVIAAYLRNESFQPHDLKLAVDNLKQRIRDME